MLLVWRKILASDLHCGKNSYGEKSYGEKYCGKIARYHCIKHSVIKKNFKNTKYLFRICVEIPWQFHIYSPIPLTPRIQSGKVFFFASLKKLLKVGRKVLRFLKAFLCSICRSSIMSSGGRPKITWAKISKVYLLYDPSVLFLVVNDVTAVYFFSIIVTAVCNEKNDSR